MRPAGRTRRLAARTAVLLLLLAGCTGEAPPAANGGTAMELRYAEQFTVDYDSAGRALVTINGTDCYLVLPEGAAEPEEGGDGAVLLRLPLPALYAASSSVLDFFRALDALDAVRFTSSRSADWSLPEVRAALDDGRLLYAGKYSAPDFEALLWEGCGLAIENTMILHSPDIREQLEALGIPVLVERSSYEIHPLGRMEWVKLYGLLTGRTEEAAAFFEQQAEIVERIAKETAQTGADRVTAAFFSVNPNGSVSVRRTGDYMTRMIELAGGRSVFEDLLPEEDSARYAVNMQMESFYAAARDADVLIYNGTVDGGVDTVDQLLGKSALLGDFRAVRNGNVWCTERNLFQEPTAAAGIIADLHAVFSGTAEESLTYLRHVEPSTYIS
ncbi:MAG: ABC transporter substrate-binding protein [Oscillibacter sp.]|nr:ABC transporter substrate-binding protein [Oscillibacter sp.]